VLLLVVDDSHFNTRQRPADRYDAPAERGETSAGLVSLSIYNISTDSMMIPLLTASHVAQPLIVSKSSIRLWAECGKLQGIKVGRQWRSRSKTPGMACETRAEPSEEKQYSLPSQAVKGECGNNGMQNLDGTYRSR